MASVTPGVLLKLLQSMNSSSSSEHRSPVLQITGIAPATSDLWPSPTGFYLQLSDSIHSTYVSLSLSDRDADSIQPGQLVHVDRLLPAHPVPRVSGLRPIPFHRSPPPILGDPSPLSLSFPSPSNTSTFLIQPAARDSAPPPVAATRTVFSSRENESNISDSADSAAAAPAAAPIKRRFSSPAATGAKRRDPSPVAGGRKSRASSPVPSKCAVPSLLAAREENRKNGREPAIVVPSRYRQPSPVGGGRRGSVSPGAGRRLSGGMKGLSPGGGGGGEGGSGGGKKRVGVVVAGISRVSDALMGSSGRSSAASARKSWDENAGGFSGEGKEKEKVSKSKVDQQQAILRTQVAISQRLSDVGREQPTSEEEDAPKNEKQNRTVKKTDSSLSDKKLNHDIAPKITVHDRKWTNGSIPFDTVSENLARLGKEALQRRNVASAAAAEALEEALATESVIRCLSMFSELCSSSKAGNPLPTIDRFLSIYEDAMKWISISESLAAARSSNGPNESISSDTTKPSSLWVEAALATDLEVVSLLNSVDGCLKQKSSGKTSVPSADTPRMSFSKRSSSATPGKTLQAKVVPGNGWSRGQCVGENLNFARSLRREMQSWFMRFVEDALDVGFRLFGEALGNGGEASYCKDNGRVAAVLSQLKRVNDWLDAVGKKPDEEMSLAEKIERLKRKIYGFVITHVGSAFDSSVSLSKA